MKKNDILSFGQPSILLALHVLVLFLTGLGPVHTKATDLTSKSADINDLEVYETFPTAGTPKLGWYGLKIDDKRSHGEPGPDSAYGTGTNAMSINILVEKLVLTKQVSHAKAQLGQVISYTVTLANNGTGAASNVIVNDRLSGVSVLMNSVSASIGSYSPGIQEGTWAIASLPAGVTATLVFSASIIGEGILYNTASIPGQVAPVCTSVPFRVCQGSTYSIGLNAPAGFTRYQWLYTAPGATTAVVVADSLLSGYTATKAGEYKLMADDGVSGLCAKPSCCPVYIDEITMPTFRAVGEMPTCLASVTQRNGLIRLTGLGTDLGRYQYQASGGSHFQAVGVPPAMPIPGDGVVMSNLLAGPYTVRVWDMSGGKPGCPRDATVTLAEPDCVCPPTVCLPVSIRKTKSIVVR